MNFNMKYLIDFLALGFVYFFFYKKWSNKGKDILLVNTLMFVYLTFVLYFTLMPIIVSVPFIFTHPYALMSMIPFEDYFANRGDTVRQILLNVLMMIPFGFLLPIIKKCRFWRCIIYTFLFSLIIELLQPLINDYRSADITDLITNTIGGLLGYLLYLVLRQFVEVILIRIRNAR